MYFWTYFDPGRRFRLKSPAAPPVPVPATWFAPVAFAGGGVGAACWGCVGNGCCCNGLLALCGCRLMYGSTTWSPVPPASSHSADKSPELKLITSTHENVSYSTYIICIIILYSLLINYLLIDRAVKGVCCAK